MSTKIIDCHVHLGRVEAWDLDLDYAVLRKHIDQHAVVRTLVFPIITQHEIDPKANDPLFELMAADERLIVFPWINPSSRDPRHIAACIDYLEARKDRIQGVKYHPSISQVGFDDDLLVPLLEYVDEKGWPWIIHSGRADISDAQRVYVRAKQFKRSSFIVAHLGGGVYDKIMEAITFFKKEHMPDNVYFDSSQTTHSVLVKRYVEAFGAGKLIFGSDIPFLDFELVMHTINSNRFRDVELEMIFSRNMEQLLRVPIGA